MGVGSLPVFQTGADRSGAKILGRTRRASRQNLDYPTKSYSRLDHRLDTWKCRAGLKGLQESAKSDFPQFSAQRGGKERVAVWMRRRTGKRKASASDAYSQHRVFSTATEQPVSETVGKEGYGTYA
jgi:hypothetical protein